MERPHAAIVLGPDADVLKLRVGRGAGSHYFGTMPPVHALIMDRAVNRIGREMPECRLQKCRKLGRRHFPGCHREFAVLDRAEASDMPRNRHVVGRAGSTVPRTSKSRKLSLIGVTSVSAIACARRIR